MGKGVFASLFGGAVAVVGMFLLAGLCLLAAVVLGIVLLVRR